MLTPQIGPAPSYTEVPNSICLRAARCVPPPRPSPFHASGQPSHGRPAHGRGRLTLRRCSFGERLGRQLTAAAAACLPHLQRRNQAPPRHTGAALWRPEPLPQAAMLSFCRHWLVPLPPGRNRTHSLMPGWPQQRSRPPLKPCDPVDASPAGCAHASLPPSVNRETSLHSSARSLDHRPVFPSVPVHYL